MVSTNTFITQVEFPEPVNGKTIYYFGSMVAIYEMFTHREIGLRLSTLSHRNLNETPLDTGKCKISRHIVYRYKRAKENAENTPNEA